MTEIICLTTCVQFFLKSFERVINYKPNNQWWLSQFLLSIWNSLDLTWIRTCGPTTVEWALSHCAKVNTLNTVQYNGWVAVFKIRLFTFHHSKKYLFWNENPDLIKIREVNLSVWYLNEVMETMSLYLPSTFPPLKLPLTFWKSIKLEVYAKDNVVTYFRDLLLSFYCRYWINSHCLGILLDLLW